MRGAKGIPDPVGTYQRVLGAELDHRNEVNQKIAFWVLWLLQRSGRKEGIHCQLKCLRSFRQGFSDTSLLLLGC